MLCGAAYRGEGAAKGVTCIAGKVGAGEERLPSKVESRGRQGLWEIATILPRGKRGSMLVWCCMRLNVAVPQGRAPRQEAELTGRTVGGACPERVPS